MKNTQMSDRVEAALIRAFEKLKAMDSTEFRARIDRCQSGGIADLLDRGQYLYAQNAEFEAYKSCEYVSCPGELIYSPEGGALTVGFLALDATQNTVYGNISGYIYAPFCSSRVDNDAKIIIEPSAKAIAA